MTPAIRSVRPSTVRYLAARIVILPFAALALWMAYALIHVGPHDFTVFHARTASALALVLVVASGIWRQRPWGSWCAFSVGGLLLLSTLAMAYAGDIATWRQAGLLAGIGGGMAILAMLSLRPRRRTTAGIAIALTGGVLGVVGWTVAFGFCL